MIEAESPPDFSHLVDYEFVCAAFEDATRTLLALPHPGFSTALAQSPGDVVRDLSEAYGYVEVENRLPVPRAAKITAMEVIFMWLTYIPDGNRQLRRIVALRSVTHKVSLKPMAWAKIGRIMGANDYAVKSWHSRAIGMIMRELNRPGVFHNLAGFPTPEEIMGRGDQDEER